MFIDTILRFHYIGTILYWDATRSMYQLGILPGCGIWPHVSGSGSGNFGHGVAEVISKSFRSQGILTERSELGPQGVRQESRDSQRRGSLQDSLRRPTAGLPSVHSNKVAMIQKPCSLSLHCR